MAIKMDGHIITALQLKASDGSEVTKQLTEEGTIPTPTGTKQITANGNGIDVTNYAAVDVNVQGGGDTPIYQEKTATQNGVVLPDEGYDALSKVTVNVSGGGLPTSISKIDGGTFTVEADTVCNTLRIEHNLGKLPAGFCIWCDAFSETTTYPVSRLMTWYARYFQYTNDNGSTYRNGGYVMLQRQANGSAIFADTYFNYPLERFGTSTDVCAYDPNINFIPGVTYKWAVWE